jgi:hypothetical protein
MAIKLGRVVQFPTGEAAQIPFLSGSRINLAVSSTSTTATALPAGAKVVVVRATEAVWLRFGASGVAAAAADANSILFLAGESVMAVPYSSEEVFSTHVRALRVGANDSTLQIEMVPTSAS